MMILIVKYAYLTDDRSFVMILEILPLYISVFLINPIRKYISLLINVSFTVIPVAFISIIQHEEDLLASRILRMTAIVLTIFFFKHYEDKSIDEERKYFQTLELLRELVIKEKEKSLQLLRHIVPCRLLLHFQHSSQRRGKGHIVLQHVCILRIRIRNNPLRELSTKKGDSSVTSKECQSNHVKTYFELYSRLSNLLDRIGSRYGMFRIRDGVKERITFMAYETNPKIPPHQPIVDTCLCALEIRDRFKSQDTDSFELLRSIFKLQYFIAVGNVSLGLDTSIESKVRFFLTGHVLTNVLDSLEMVSPHSESRSNCSSTGTKCSHNYYNEILSIQPMIELSKRKNSPSGKYRRTIRTEQTGESIRIFKDEFQTYEVIRVIGRTKRKSPLPNLRRWSNSSLKSILSPSSDKRKGKKEYSRPLTPSSIDRVKEDNKASLERNYFKVSAEAIFRRRKMSLLMFLYCCCSPFCFLFTTTRFEVMKVEKMYKNWVLKQTGERDSRILVCIFLGLFVKILMVIPLIVDHFDEISIMVYVQMIIIALQFGVVAKIFHYQCKQLKCLYFYLLLDIGYTISWFLGGLCYYPIRSFTFYEGRKSPLIYFDQFYYISQSLFLYHLRSVLPVCALSLVSLARTFLWVGSRFVYFYASETDYGDNVTKLVFALLECIPAVIVSVSGVTRILLLEHSSRNLFKYSFKVQRLLHFLLYNRSLNQTTIFNSLPLHLRQRKLFSLVYEGEENASQKGGKFSTVLPLPSTQKIYEPLFFGNCSCCVLMIHFEWFNESVTKGDLRKLRKVAELNEILEKLIENEKYNKIFGNIEILHFNEHECVIVHYHPLSTSSPLSKSSPSSTVNSLIRLSLRIIANVCLIPHIYVRICISDDDLALFGVFGEHKEFIDLFSPSSIRCQEILGEVERTRSLRDSFRNAILVILEDSNFESNYFALISAFHVRTFSFGGDNGRDFDTTVNDADHFQKGKRTIFEIKGRREIIEEKKKKIVMGKDTLKRRKRRFQNLEITKFLPKLGNQY